MADKKISQLTGAALPLAGTEVLPIVQSGSTVKVASDDLTVKNVRSNATTGILQVAGPAAGSTRIMTVPDANFTAARTDASNSFTGDQTLATGNLVIGTAGKGIDFSADGQAAGMTSELLDDYEEGTWTPEFSSTDATFTYSFQQGYYTKIGRQVFVHAFIRGRSAGTLSNAIFITGLPFTQSAATSAYGSVTFGQINRVDYPAGALAITGFIQSGETQIRLNVAIDDTNAGSLTAEALDGTTNAGFILSASYFTA